MELSTTYSTVNVSNISQESDKWKSRLSPEADIAAGVYLICISKYLKTISRYFYYILCTKMGGGISCCDDMDM